MLNKLIIITPQKHGRKNLFYTIFIASVLLHNMSIFIVHSHDKKKSKQRFV